MPRKTGRKNRKGRGRSGRKAAAGGLGEQRPKKDDSSEEGKIGVDAPVASEAKCGAVGGAAEKTAVDDGQKKENISIVAKTDDSAAEPDRKTAAEGEDAVQKAGVDGQRQENSTITEREQIEREMDDLWESVVSNYEHLIADDDGPQWVKDMKDSGVCKEDGTLKDDFKVVFTRALKAGQMGGLILFEKDKRILERYNDVLFEEHPQQEDCDVCFLPMPVAMTQRTYKLCCGKVVCDGCISAIEALGAGERCPFCREITRPSNEFKRVLKRVELGDPNGFVTLADIYIRGRYGQEKDEKKALELIIRAADLGSLAAYGTLARCYSYGQLGIERDVLKCWRYYEIAAMRGCVEARHALGCRSQGGQDYTSEGVKHFKIAARAGFEPSLKEVKNAYVAGQATKDEYAETLRAYCESVKEKSSEQRDKAAAFYATVPGHSKYGVLDYVHSRD